MTTKLPLLVVNQSGGKTVFNGSWFRGKHTNFIPSKADLKQRDALHRFFLKGLLPESPFVSKDVPITCFGSCFARHLSHYLYERGYKIYGKHLNLHSHIIRFGEGIVNTFVILQQLEWALLDKPMPENLWFSKDKEVALVSPEIKQETREIIQNTQVFVFTLGLSEVWFDKLSGEALWRAVPATLFDPQRHYFRQTTVSENAHNIKRIIELVQEVKPDAQIIFTLSPVPLMATFRPIPCVIANSVSKATLRCALDEALHATEWSKVHYFPSYEIVMSSPESPFIDDNRHIKPKIVDGVLRTFEKYFCVT